MTKVIKGIEVPQRADFVGSFLRPADLNPGNIDQRIAEVVEKQKQLGYHIISDGEYNRTFWHLDFFWGFGGVAHEAGGDVTFNGETARLDKVYLKSKLFAQPHPFIEAYRRVKKHEDADHIAKLTIPSPSQFFQQLTIPQNFLGTRTFYSNLDEKLSRKLRTRALYEHFSYKHSAVRGFLCTMFVKAIGIFDHYFFDNVLCSAFNTLFSTSWMKDKLSLPANVDKSLTSVVTPPGNLVELDPECHIISINVSPSLLQQHFDYAGHSGEITFLYSDQSLADDSYRAFKQESISHDVFWYNLLNPLFDVSEVFGKRTVFYRLEFQCKAFLPGIIQRLLSFTDERLVIILDSSTPDIDAVSETVKQELSYYCSDISTSASDFGISLSCRILTALR